MGRLERVIGAAADGEPWLDQADRALASATAIGEADPRTCVVVAYDAVRCAATGLLAQQGLRPTREGGHLAVEDAVRAQFGAELAEDFRDLRLWRHQLEYPLYPGERVGSAEVAEALSAARAFLTGARALLGSLGLFAGS